MEEKEEEEEEEEEDLEKKVLYIQCINVSIYQSIKVSIPMYQCIIVSMYQCINVLMYQCINLSMYQCINASIYKVSKHQCINEINEIMYKCINVQAPQHASPSSSSPPSPSLHLDKIFILYSRVDIPHLSTVSISPHSIYITPISHFKLLHDMISGSLLPTLQWSVCIL